MEQFWAALRASRWSRACELRQLVQLHESIDSDYHQPLSLYMQKMGPQGLIDTLEDLVREEKMSPLAARRIEEQILQKTDARGLWLGA
jgi:hypothetical protein